MQNQNKTLYIRVALLLISGILALLAFSLSHFEQSQKNTEGPVTSVTIGDNRFEVLIADTPFSRQKGLSDRLSLEEEEGMLFIFDDSDVRGFWMKDMLFPLDIVWIDENQKIVGISENLQPESFPESFSSLVPVQYVLEINASVAKKKNIKVGDEVRFIRE